MPEPRLHPDFKEFLSCLTSRGVRFLIVGAHAMAVLGRPRATDDIDILVEPTTDNASRLGQALADFGFSEHAAAAADHFAQPDRMATLGRAPLRIDILSSISGVTFDEAWQGRVHALVDDIELDFLGLEQMRATKRAANRPKDQVDLALLEELETGRKDQ